MVGHGIAGELPALVGDQARTVVLIHAAGPGVRWPGRRCEALAAAGYTVRAEPVPAGEAAKDIGVAAALWSRLAAHRISRSDAIVGLGGGAVTDLAGFVAATWLRGVRVGPGADHAARDRGRGDRRQDRRSTSRPARTWSARFTRRPGCWPTWTRSAALPRREYVSGLAEVIKAGFIADPAILGPDRGRTRPVPPRPAARTSASWSSGRSR